MMTRKSFLEQITLLTAGAYISPLLATPKPFTKIGLQLYTLHHQVVDDIQTIIAEVSKCGYQDVETYDFNTSTKAFSGYEAKTFKKILTDHGLQSTSGHYNFNQLFTTGKDDDVKTYIEAAKTLGQTYIVVPALDAAIRRTANQYQLVAERLNKAAVWCKDAGINLLYHNHDFEFDRLADGSTGYEILLKHTDQTFQFEMDLYWVVRGGQQPIDLFNKYPGRFPLWHVKDMSKQYRTIETEIGKGSIDFAAIFKLAKLAGAVQFFVEQENNYVPNPYESIAQSATYIKNNLL